MGRYLAEHIPGSAVRRAPQNRLVSAVPRLPSLLDEIEQFLTGTRPAPVPDRVLATVLFTDVVGSTELASRLGDQRWIDLLAQHHSRVRFADYADEWLATYRAHVRRHPRGDDRRVPGALLGRSKRDVELMRRDGQPMGAVAFFGRRRLAEVEPRDVKRYVAELLACGYAANTVRLFLAPVKALCHALEDGLVRANPTAGVRIPRPAQTDDEERVCEKAFTLGQVLRVLDAVPSSSCSRRSTRGPKTTPTSLRRSRGSARSAGAGSQTR